MLAASSSISMFPIKFQTLQVVNQYLANGRACKTEVVERQLILREAVVDIGGRRLLESHIQLYVVFRYNLDVEICERSPSADL